MSNAEVNKINELKTNIAYSAAIARIKYARVPAPLPKYNDINAMSRYWRKYYNSNNKLSATERHEKEQQFIKNWNRYNEKS